MGEISDGYIDTLVVPSYALSIAPSKTNSAGTRDGSYTTFTAKRRSPRPRCGYSQAVFLSSSTILATVTECFLCGFDSGLVEDLSRQRQPYPDSGPNLLCHL